MLNSNNEIASELISFLQEQNLSSVALVTTGTPNHLITNDIEVALFDKVQKLKTFQVINASISYVNQLPLTDFDVVVGIGGGKVIDTAKYAAHINNIPCVSIPTAISNDGICSPVAVLKEKHNTHKSLGATIPAALFVPLHIIEKSDEESIISGIGDLLSNLSAIEDWKLAASENGEFIDDYAVMVSKQAALSIYTEIKNYILQRKTKSQFIKENLEMIVESLALSGVAMEIAGTSRPASGAEHLISHAIDELFGGLKSHGIQVAFGMFITTFLRAELGLVDKKHFEELRAIFRFLGLPTRLSEVGLTENKLIQVLEHAPNTRSDRYSILSKINTNYEPIKELISNLFGQKTTIAI